MYPLYKGIFCLLPLLILAGCGTRDNLAPVTELRAQGFSRGQNIHRVRQGETLYAIAFGYDTDFRQLARLNHLSPPYRLRVGQILRVNTEVNKRIVLPQYNPRSSYVTQKKPQAIYPSQMRYYGGSGWQWPLRGRIVTSFIPAQGKKGINIASNQGEKVHAASNGVVAYAGSGLAGYGNLIIIKHNNEYLTAYGNNARNLVSEGQYVKAGQVIAEVGLIDRRYWGVHFEIRKMGVPVNPLSYLKG